MRASRRRSIEIPGVGHGAAPIPMGARVGPIVHSSGIPGTDAHLGVLPSDSKEQVRHAFLNLDSFLSAAGVTLDEVVRLTVLLTSEDLRDTVNEEWLARFPDPAGRPARHITLGPLRAGMLIQLEVMAVAAD